MGDMIKLRPNKKLILPVLGVLGVLAIAAGAGIGLRMLQNHNEANKPVSTVFKGEPLPAKVDEAQNLRVTGDVDGSIKKIDQALADDDTTKEEKYLLYIQQGNAYHDKKDLDASIASYLEAETVKQTYEITALLAEMYEEKGDKPKAIEYYKKSIPLIPNTPMRGQYKKDAEAKIQQLGGQL